jgi:hypothetical protein
MQAVVASLPGQLSLASLFRSARVRRAVVNRKVTR